MAFKTNEGRYTGAFIGGGIGAVLDLAGGPLRVAIGAVIGGTVGHAIAERLDEQRQEQWS